MTVQGTFNPSNPSLYGADAGPAGQPLAERAPAAVLRADDPFSSELAEFLARRIAAARGGVARGGVARGGVAADGAADGPAPPAATLDALLDAGGRWPVHLALLLLRRIAAVLDAADAAGVALGTFTPRCVAFDGAYLVLAPGEDPDAADPEYVAPEQRLPGAVVDARASQFGLAYLAAALLDSSTPAAEFGPDVESALLAARDPNPAERFLTAGVFVTALTAACGGGEAKPGISLAATVAATAGATVATAVATTAGMGDRATDRALEHDPGRAALARMVAPHQTPAVRPGASRRVAGVAGLVGLAVVAGVGAGWYAAQRPLAGDGPAAGRPAAGRMIADSAPGTVAARTAPRGGVARPDRAADGGVDRAAGGAEGPAPRATPARDASQARRALAPAAAEPGAAPDAEVPPRAAVQLGVLPAAVRLPVGDLVPDVRRPVTNPKEFAADGLGAAGAAGARPILPPALVADPRDARAVIDVAATLVVGGRPRYPEVLLASGVHGEVVVRFVVDTAGRVDARTFTVVRSSHSLFERAVRQSLYQIRYRPAEAGGRAVRQTVEQTFKFAPGG